MSWGVLNAAMLVGLLGGRRAGGDPPAAPNGAAR